MTAESRTMAWVRIIGIFIFVIPLAFCAKELVPGWNTFHLDWPPTTYYTIAAVSGALGWAMVGYRYFIPGLISGPLASLGALAVITWHLSWADWTSNVLELFFGAVGCLPGLAVFGCLAYVQNQLLPPRKIRDAGLETGEEGEPRND
jgi:hypothetical protein